MLLTAIATSIPATIIVMSFLYGLTALYSATRDLRKKVWIEVSPSNANYADLPSLAVVIPLYNEDKDSVVETFKSIVNQAYPAEKLSVFIVLEDSDTKTKRYVEELKHMLTSTGMDVRVYVNHGKRSSKANAINLVLPEIINNKYIAVMILDAGDRIIDRDYIVKCIELINRGYDIIGAKVYRVGNSLIAKFSYIDTVLWYNIGFPGIHSITKVPFLSGEGMVVTTRFLKRIKKFPEVLAEDSYIAMLGLIYGEKVGLVNSVIFEGAPSTLRSLVKQRLRWYRGGVECLKDLLTTYRKRLPKLVTIRMCLAYLQLVALTAPITSLVIVVISMFITVPQGLLMLARVEIISLVVSPLALYFISDVRDPALFLAPLNWVLQSFIALIALIPIRIPWLKTPVRSRIVIPEYGSISLKQRIGI